MKKLLWIIKAGKTQNDAELCAGELMKENPNAAVVVIIKHENQAEIINLIKTRLGDEREFTMLAISGGHGLPKTTRKLFAGFVGGEIDVIFDTLSEANVKASLILAPTCYSASYVEDLKKFLKQDGLILTSTTTAGTKYSDEIKDYSLGAQKTIPVEAGWFDFPNKAKLSREEYKQLQKILNQPPVSLSAIIEINPEKFNEYLANIKAKATMLTYEELARLPAGDNTGFPITDHFGTTYATREILYRKLISAYCEIGLVDSSATEELLVLPVEQWPYIDSKAITYLFQSQHLAPDVKQAIDDDALIKVISADYKNKHVTSTCITTHQGSYTRVFQVDPKNGQLDPLPRTAVTDKDEAPYYIATLASLGAINDIPYDDFDTLQHIFDEVAASIPLLSQEDDVFAVNEISTDELAGTLQSNQASPSAWQKNIKNNLPQREEKPPQIEPENSSLSIKVI